MKAYSYSAIFEKSEKNHNNVQNNYGAIICEYDVLVEQEVLKSPACIASIAKGYTLKAFAYELIDPNIAPMNREDTPCITD